MKARGAIVEVIQRKPARDTAGGSILVPDRLRINGQEVLCPDGEPVTIEQIDVGEDAAIVTVRMYARLVLIGTEDDAAALTRGLS